MATNKPFDVTVLGSGIAGSILAMILARHGARVLMIDAKSHPRFAIGESTVPHTTLLLEFLALRFDVPELRNLTSPKLVSRHVSQRCGIKANFGYVYHREGEPQAPHEAMQLGLTRLLRHYELHYFRQDIDSYLFHAAIRYGVTVRQNLRIEDVELGDQGTELRSATGECFRSHYIVDASGYGSPLATHMGLREKTTRLNTQSRSIFNHLIGVRPYDESVKPPQAHGMSTPWSSGTLHHIFDGGWMWVIPFNNQKSSLNPLCSVGLNLDLRRYPSSEESPADEFAAFLKRFPEIAQQFRHAKPVRNWVGTGRLQYSSHRSTGQRFCLLSHAAGFVDPFFSRGLVNSFEVIHALALRLLESLQDGDYSEDRFAYVDRLQRGLLDYNDRLVNAVYRSFSHFDLWNAVMRVWVLGTIAIEGRFVEALAKYRLRPRAELLEDFDDPPFPGAQFPYHEWFSELFAVVMAEVDAYGEGILNGSEASERIFHHLRRANYDHSIFRRLLNRPLLWAICDPDTRNLFTNGRLYLRPRTFRLAADWRRQNQAVLEGLPRAEG